MKHEAIRKLYPNAVTIDDAAGVFDKDGVKIELDEALINIEAKLQKAKYAKCAEICALRDKKILEASIEYTEAKDAETAVMALDDIDDINNYDVENSFS